MNLDFVVRVNNHDSRCTGTGIVLTTRHVLTCRHIVYDASAADCAVYGRGRWINASRLIVDDVDDLAIVEFAEPFTLPALTFLDQIQRVFEHHLLNIDWHTAGYRGENCAPSVYRIPDSAERLCGFDYESGMLNDIQIQGGLPEGHSGSPLFLLEGDVCACIGMAYLGGVRSATSRFATAGKIIDFCVLHDVHPCRRVARDMLPHPVLYRPERQWIRKLHRPPGALLRSEYGVVPFHGRTSELDEISAWCESRSHTPRIRMLLAPGGMGKTRLALEACRRQRDNGWLAGFLKPEGTFPIECLDHRTLVDAPTLFVVDYVEGRSKTLARLLKGVLAPPVITARILLLARYKSGWWDGLKAMDRDLAELIDSEATDEQLLMPLASTVDERQARFSEALSALTGALNLAPRSQHKQDLEGEWFDRILFIHMAALASIDGVEVKGESGVLDFLLDRERRFWTEASSQRGVRYLDRTVKTIERALFWISIDGRGVRTRREAEERLVAGSLDPNSDLVAEATDILHEMYGTNTYWIESFQPDVLREHLKQRLTDRDETFDELLRIVARME